jgi:hypothetical protein
MAQSGTSTVPLPLLTIFPRGEVEGVESALRRRRVETELRLRHLILSPTNTNPERETSIGPSDLGFEFLIPTQIEMNLLKRYRS